MYILYYMHIIYVYLYIYIYMRIDIRYPRTGDKPQISKDLQDLLLLCCNASNDTSRPGLTENESPRLHFAISCDILRYFVTFCDI